MLTLFRLLILLTWSLMLLAGYHPAEDDCPMVLVAVYFVQGLIAFCIAADLLCIAVNSLDPYRWRPRHTGVGYDLLDQALLLTFSCLTLTPWGLVAIVTDAAVKLFSRWAQALQESHA